MGMRSREVRALAVLEGLAEILEDAKTGPKRRLEQAEGMVRLWRRLDAGDQREEFEGPAFIPRNVVVGSAPTPSLVKVKMDCHTEDAKGVASIPSPLSEETERDLKLAEKEARKNLGMDA